MPINIETTTLDLDYLSLGIPNQIQNNLYFSRIYHNDDPIIIQTSQCYSLAGIKKANNKYFCDLIYENHQKTSDFFENLENKIKNVLAENKDEWFEESLTLEDIDDAFASPIHFHKAGIKLKTILNKNNISGNYSLNCYDTNHNLLENYNLSPGVLFLPIIEILGIKFTDKTFQLEMKLLQILILDMNNNSQQSASLFDTINQTVPGNALTHKEHTNNTNKDSKPESETDETNTDDLNDDNIYADDLNGKHRETLENGSESNILNKNVVENIESDSAEILDAPENVDSAEYTLKKNTLDENIDYDSNNNLDNDLDNDLDDNLDDNLDDDLDDNLDKASEHSETDILNLNNPEQEKSSGIEEVTLNYEYLDNNPVKLKTHSDIYEEIWKMYKSEAFKIRQQNIQIYLNSKNVHCNYLINEI